MDSNQRSVQHKRRHVRVSFESWSVWAVFVFIAPSLSSCLVSLASQVHDAIALMQDVAKRKRMMASRSISFGQILWKERWGTRAYKKIRRLGNCTGNSAKSSTLIPLKAVPRTFSSNLHSSTGKGHCFEGRRAGAFVWPGNMMGPKHGCKVCRGEICCMGCCSPKCVPPAMSLRMSHGVLEWQHKEKQREDSTGARGKYFKPLQGT